jgi:hypothetical protein
MSCGIKVALTWVSMMSVSVYFCIKDKGRTWR